MSQPTKIPSTPSTVPGTTPGNAGESRSVGRRAGSRTIAIEGEGGVAYVKKIMAQGGPARIWETNNYPQLPRPMPVNAFPICPSPASDIQDHVPFLFASELVEHYSGTQSQIAAPTNAPATEAVAPQEKR